MVHIHTYVYNKIYTLSQAMHIQDEMAEKVQELEEELTMALCELKKAKDSNKLLSEVMAENTMCSAQVQCTFGEIDLIR